MACTKTGLFLAAGDIFNTLSPNNTHTNSPNWSLHISLKNELRELKDQSIFSPVIILLIPIT